MTKRSSGASVLWGVILVAFAVRIAAGARAAEGAHSATAAPPAAVAPPVYPDDAYSRPAVDRLATFETRVGVVAMTPLLQRGADFSLHRIELASREGRSFTHWRFTRRPGSRAVPGLGLENDRVRRAPVKVTVRVA
ncbi:MAG: hypothetical protein M1457_07725, partial [bacterium]|nr:hypothetical protein [bacterium]